MNQKRQPKGTTIGGQFAASKNPESHIDLVAEGAAQASRYGRHIARRYGLGGRLTHGFVDLDDFAQDAALAFVVASRTEKGQNAPEELPANVIAKWAVIRALAHGRERENNAQRILTARRVERENALGRSLTPKEVEVLAEEVRLSIDSDRRPGAGYHLSLTVAPFTDVATAFHESEGEGRSHTPDYPWKEDVVSRDDFAEGSAGDMAWSFVEAGQKSKSRALVWDAVAERSGAPSARRGTLPKRAATRAREELREAGGAYRAARSYLDGDEVVPALFAPFGDIDEPERESVARLLESFPDFADDLWTAAASTAEGRNAQ